ncbi:MAG TPA: thioredoxin family protein [Bacteroidales bacterium]|jgi:thioredoxin-related protein|nr:thioredoxin family protein [Bacteroidales bacterium]
MKLRQLIFSGFFLALTLMVNQTYAQTEKKLYDPSLDGMTQIKGAIAKAKSTGKHVLIQYGGNWCPWCIRFDAFCKADPEISKAVEDNYIPVKLNYSPENRNDAANEFLGNPVRFGFPVFIIIDCKGKVIHIQDSALLESGQGYDQKKVTGFMKNWTASAIIPKKK